MQPKWLFAAVPVLAVAMLAGVMTARTPPRQADPLAAVLASPAPSFLPASSRMMLATGQECPANSGKYCPDQFPECCMIHGDWVCVAKREDCHE